MFDNRILHIEDNFHNRRIVRKILEKQGYVLHEAADGIIGFNMIKEFNPPVVLLDISLPGMDGIEIAQRVKADDKYKHIILIAVTASAMQGDRERFLAAGCDDYLSKPFRSIDLIEIVNQHFEKLKKMEGVEEASPVEEELLEPSELAESSITFNKATFHPIEGDTQKSEDGEIAETPEPELEASKEKSELLKTASLQAVFSGQEPLPVEEEDEPSLEEDVPEEAEQEEIPEPELSQKEEADETLRWPSFQSLKAKQGLEMADEETPGPEHIAPMEVNETLDTVSSHEDEEEIPEPVLDSWGEEEETPEPVFIPYREDEETTRTLPSWVKDVHELETTEEETPETGYIAPMEVSETLDTVSLHEDEEEIPEPVLDSWREEEETPEPVFTPYREDDETTRTPPSWVKEVQELETEEEETPESEHIAPMEVSETLDTVSLHEDEKYTQELEELETEEIPEPIPMASMEGNNITTAPLTGLMEDSAFEEEVEEEEYIETIQVSHEVEDATRPLVKPKRVRDLMEEVFSTKAGASESEQQDEMTSKIINMINADTIRPVDPNVDFDSA